MNATTSTTDPAARGSRWFALTLLAIGSFGFAAAWVLVAFARDRQCSWMALLAAIDAALLLRLARMPGGWTRVALAVAATATTIVLANWGIAAVIYLLDDRGALTGTITYDEDPSVALSKIKRLVGIAIS